MIKIKTISLFRGNPHRRDRTPDFLNNFKQQPQQFLCTGKAKYKGQETNKARNEQRNSDKSHCAPVMKGQLTAMQNEKKR